MRNLLVARTSLSVLPLLVVLAPLAASTLSGCAADPDRDGDDDPHTQNLETWVRKAVSPPIESPHPYGPNSSQSWSIEAPSCASKFRVHFEFIDVEASYDSVRLTDENGNKVKWYTGAFSGVSDDLPGNTANVQLVSDASVQANGFRIDWIEYTGATCAPAEICDNGIDDDGNGKTDCADPACTAAPYCQSERSCDNGFDDDGDGKTDCNDPDCNGTQACSVPGPSAMAYTRSKHTASVLKDGRVLVIGGYGGSCNPEIYDPATGTWSVTAALAACREEGNAASLLNDGTVLVTGGYGSTSPDPYRYAERYDVRNNIWLNAGTTTQPRRLHTSTLLTDGRVLLTGSVGSVAGATAEVYDPPSKTFTAVASMNNFRFHHTATRLTDGRVLVIGGTKTNGQSINTCEIFDPANNTWAPTRSMVEARTGHTATLLHDGRVLVVGGSPVWPHGSVTGYMAAQRGWHTATLLGPGKLLAVGGDVSSITGQKTAEYFFTP